MLIPHKMGVLAFVAFSSALVLASFGQSAYAATPQRDITQEEVQTQPLANIPLEIEPTCSDSQTGMSYWKVTNKNIVSVQVSWNNVKNTRTGIYQATPGLSRMTTSYNKDDPNNTTAFTYQGMTTQTNATAAGCNPGQTVYPTLPIIVTNPATPPVTEPQICVEGKIQQNLNVEYLTNSTVTIRTVDGKKLCHDVTIYLSSYIMPANYDRGVFKGNQTAYPQSIFSSKAATLRAGTNGQTILIIQLPSKCENVQLDVYYAPEITTVGENGHGEQNILSKVLKKDTSADCNPVAGKGGVIMPILIPAASTPIKSSSTSVAVVNKPLEIASGGRGDIKVPAAVTELPHTGPSSTFNIMPLGILLAAFVYFVTYRLIPRTRDEF